MSEERLIFIRAHHLLHFEWAFRHGPKQEAGKLIETIERVGDVDYMKDLWGENHEHKEAYRELIVKAYENAVRDRDVTSVVVSVDHKDDLCAAARHGTHCEMFHDEVESDFFRSFLGQCRQSAVPFTILDDANVKVSANDFRRIMASPRLF